MDSIIVRSTQDNQPAVFLLDTLNTRENCIDMWVVNGEAPRTVGLDVYRTTKPVGEVLEGEVVNKYRARFNPAGGVVLRSRLYKVSPEKGGSHVIPQHMPAVISQPNSFVNSPSNLAHQQREATGEPEPKPRLTMQEWDKAVFVERVMNAFTQAMAAAMKEALKP